MDKKQKRKVPWEVPLEVIRKKGMTFEEKVPLVFKEPSSLGESLLSYFREKPPPPQETKPTEEPKPKRRKKEEIEKPVPVTKWMRNIKT